MFHDAHNVYLETQIKTAPPQKLRLMLIEGGIRFIQRAQAGFEQGMNDEALVALARARDIVTELLVSVRPEASPLHRTTRGIYAFLFRTLAEAHLRNSTEQLPEVLRVLEEERATWQQVCELFPEAEPMQEVLEEVSAPHHLAGPNFATASAGFTCDA